MEVHERIGPLKSLVISEFEPQVPAWHVSGLSIVLYPSWAKQVLLHKSSIAYLNGLVKLSAMAKTDMKSVGKNLEKVSGSRMSVDRNSSIGVAICFVAEILVKFNRICGIRMYMLERKKTWNNPVINSAYWSSKEGSGGGATFDLLL